MKVLSIRNAKWVRPNEYAFNCEILFEEIPNEWLPFTFTRDDQESHSVWIKDVWLTDNASEVAPYVPPTEEEIRAEKAAEVTLLRNQLLVESDVYVLPDRWYLYSEEVKQNWATYRQALRDIPEQTGFPFEVVWPVKPV